MPPRERKLEAALGPALNAGPVPADGRELVRYAGGRRALTEQLSGMAGPPRPASYKTPESFHEAQRTWRAASQAALRYDKGARTPSVSRGTKSRIRKAANKARRAVLRERGLRARIMGTVMVASPGGRDDERSRVMPSGGPGELIPGATVGEILDQIDSDDRDAAAEDFEAAFMEAYAFEEGVITSVQWIKLWPEGETEPR